MPENYKLYKDLLILNLGANAYSRILAKYCEIFEAEYDLVLCVARRSFDLLCAFKPILEVAAPYFDFSKVTHTNMTAAWLSQQELEPTQLSVCLVDDTYLFGHAIKKIAQQLHDLYNFSVENISVCCFARKDSGNEVDTFDVSFDGSMETKILPQLEPCFLTDFFDAKKYSASFIKAIHATSTPYVAYMSAMSFSIDVARKYLFKDPFPDYTQIIELSQLSEKISESEWEFRHISVPPVLDTGVETFCLFPRKNMKASLLGEKYVNIDVCAAIRFYVNYNLQKVMMIPYITIKPGIASNDIRNCFSKDSAIYKLSQTRKSVDRADDTINYARQQLAHRLLRYSYSYLLGQNFLGSVLSLDEYAIESFGGIPATMRDGSSNLFEELQKCTTPSLIDNFLGSATLYKTGNLKVTMEQATLANSLLSNIKAHFPESKTFGMAGLLDEELFQLNLNISKDDVRFEGIPLDLLYGEISVLNDKFDGFSVNDYYAEIFKLCDLGCAVSRVVCFDGIIGTALVSGELTGKIKDILHPGIMSVLHRFQKNEKHVWGIFRAVAKEYLEQKDIGMSCYVSAIIDRINARETLTPLSSATLANVEPDDVHSRFFTGLYMWCDDYLAIEDGANESDSKGFREFVFANSDQSETDFVWQFLNVKMG
ncbi:hypothetical protein FACS1894202_07550 [Clostridia bacterium]|nr:hypothetical protein FACS1894202_07550 [Clostridia bacterium]